MRISVRTRTTKRGLEPCSICVGRSYLPVVRVLACRELPEHRCYELDVLDGRCFVIHHAPQSDVWELEAVYTDGLALRSMRKAARRAGKLREQRQDVVTA